MKNKKLSAAALLAIFVVQSVNAVQTPAPGTNDDRIRKVRYDADDIVRIIAAHRYSTHIVFEEGEVIQHIAAGDSVAWELAPIANDLFIKPVEDAPDTNITVLTNRRRYEFDLVATRSSTTTKSPKGIYTKVSFTYPDTVIAQQEADRRALRAVKAAIGEQQRKQSLLDDLATAETPPRKNVNYWVQGSEDVAPDEAWDDGTFTYFRFRGAREIPAVFIENLDKSEGLVNTLVKGDTIVIQRLARRFVLRKGNAVAAIDNQGYTIGDAPTTSTIAPNVERDVHGEENPTPLVFKTRPTAANAPKPPTTNPTTPVVLPATTQNQLPATQTIPTETQPEAGSQP